MGEGEEKEVLVFLTAGKEKTTNEGEGEGRRSGGRGRGEDYFFFRLFSLLTSLFACYRTGQRASLANTGWQLLRNPSQGFRVGNDHDQAINTSARWTARQPKGEGTPCRRRNLRPIVPVRGRESEPTGGPALSQLVSSLAGARRRPRMR